MKTNLIQNSDGELVEYKEGMDLNPSRKADERTWKVSLMVKSYGNWALGFAWVNVTLGGYPMDGLALYASHRANEPIRRVVGSVKEAMIWFQSNRIPARAAGKFLADAMAHELAPASWQPRTEIDPYIEATLAGHKATVAARK